MNPVPGEEVGTPGLGGLALCIACACDRIDEVGSGRYDVVAFRSVVEYAGRGSFEGLP
jgi:hypothetical protein